MTCRSDDWMCELLARLGLSGFSARTVEVLIGTPLKIALILVAAVILSRIGCRIVRRGVMAVGARSGLRNDSLRLEQRTTTLGGVASNTVRVIVWTLAVLAALEETGFNLGPLLAGASIVGVAVGFGAQSLVRDFVSGFFILAEDQYGVGDTIVVSDVTGTVEDVSLRLTRLRAADGTVWFVPNGEIRKVGNAAKGWALASADIVLRPGTDCDRALAVVNDEARVLAEDPDWAPRLTGVPEAHVEAVTAEGLTVRITARTAPADRVQVARHIRARMVTRLHKDGLAGVTAPAAEADGDDDADAAEPLDIAVRSDSP